jgi:ectoine hydroxylase-related dioxygenase (phytanoyl-CoA dioxygenase family)
MTLTAPRSDSRATAVTQRLTAAEVAKLKQSFAENGYVVLKNVVSREGLADLAVKMQQEFENQLRTGRMFNGGGLVSGHLNASPGEAGRFAYEDLKDYGVVDLVREIAPQSVREPYVGCNFNLPGSVTQHYHMDRTFTNEFMIINVAVVDTVIENGAIELAPGTHRQFYKFWRWAIERPYRKSIRQPMEQGDVLIRVSNLWHRGMPNLSRTPRPMLAFTWEDGGSQDPDPFAKNGGKIEFRPNWFRPSKLGRLRERVFVAAPLSYSAYRFVDSMVSNKSY